MKACSIGGCLAKYHAKGFCNKHYRRYKNNGDPLLTLREVEHEGCSTKGCGEKYWSKGLCRNHYMAQYNSRPENKKKAAEYRTRPENRERRAEQGAKSKSKKRRAEWYVERKYGITPTQYQEVLENQGNKCAICGSQTVGDKRKTRFCVDHEHVLGYEEMSSFEKMKYFRGLLCHSCNCMLKEGYEDFETLQKYIDYIKNPPAKELGLKYALGKVRGLRNVLVSKFDNKCWIDCGHFPVKRCFL